MPQRHRPTYTPEFRAEAVRLVRASSERFTTVARDLGVSVSTLRSWVKGPQSPTDPPLTDAERRELQVLRRENRELRMERDILKKATAFFAKHSA
jgi:transposase